MNAPGTCVDCGNEAYIKLAGEGEEMICAHCFDARRLASARVSPPQPAAREDQAAPPGRGSRGS